MIELESPDSGKVGTAIGRIFLDFLKIQLKDVHTLQKVAVAEIQVRGNVLDK